VRDVEEEVGGVIDGAGGVWRCVRKVRVGVVKAEEH